MPYAVFMSPRASRELGKLPRDTHRRIHEAIERLEREPRPPGAEKLTGSESTYGVRVGDYRVVYELSDDPPEVRVTVVRHRRDVYRRP